MNKQPYTLCYEYDNVKIIVDSDIDGSQYIDAGIAAAHAIVEFGQGTVTIEENNLIIKNE